MAPVDIVTAPDAAESTEEAAVWRFTAPEVPEVEAPDDKDIEPPAAFKAFVAPALKSRPAPSAPPLTPKLMVRLPGLCTRRVPRAKGDATSAGLTITSLD